MRVAGFIFLMVLFLAFSIKKKHVNSVRAHIVLWYRKLFYNPKKDVKKFKDKLKD